MLAAKKIFPILCCIIFFSATASFAKIAEERTYKISVIAFQYPPTKKNISTRVLTPWPSTKFDDSVLIDQRDAEASTEKTSTDSENSLLSAQDSTLSGAAYTLSKNSNTTIVYHGTWISSFIANQPKLFHLHNLLENGEIFDALIQITMKYYFTVDFQSQLLLPQSTKNLNYYNIIALNESYQTPSNEIYSIDSPNYGVLIKIVRL